jgi:hypothetical protein
VITKADNKNDPFIGRTDDRIMTRVMSDEIICKSPVTTYFEFDAL